MFSSISPFSRRRTGPVHDFQVSRAACVVFACPLLSSFPLLLFLACFCRSEETPSVFSGDGEPISLGCPISSAPCRHSSCLAARLGPCLRMVWVLPPAAAFFCTGASGLVCTGRLLQNMLGLGCEFKGKELFCTRILP